MSEPIKRKLIEVALPLEAINREAVWRKTKAPTGFPTQIHKWWAQRPSAACRAILFASLVDDPSSDPDRYPTPKAQDDRRQELFSLIEELVQWSNTTNEEVLGRARAEVSLSTRGNPPDLLDPFCGGGTIPLEAQRLGLVTHASDLNPVAVLITKALIEIPPRFAAQPPVHPDARRGVGSTGTWSGAAGLARDVRHYGAWMRDQAEGRIGHLYPKTRLPKEQGGGEAPVIAWLWARTVICPNPACGTRMPLVRSFELSRRKGREAWAIPVVDQDARRVSFMIGGPQAKSPEAAKTGRGASFRCLVCGQTSPDQHIKTEGLAKRMGAQLMAIVAEGQHGRIYLPPDPTHVHIAESASPAWVPEGDLSKNARHSTPPTYGMSAFADLFTPRQLVALTTLCDLVGEIRTLVLSDALAAGLPDDATPLRAGGLGATAYADAIAIYLTLAIGRVSDYGSTLATWMPKDAAVRNTFARQALPMTWDYVEANPFEKSSANIRSAADNVADCLDFVPAHGRATVTQQDAGAAALPAALPAALICTDPPYYDNVPYADLSDFFYVWFRRSLRPVEPGLFGTLLSPKSAELVADPVRHRGRLAAREHFENGLSESFAHIRLAASPAYPITVYYAFKQAESDGDEGTVPVSTGWDAMLEALLAAGLLIDGTWPVSTEGPGRLRARAANALSSSVVFVCRQRPGDAGITTRKDFVACLKRELPEALRTLQHGNIAPVDLAQASIGPGMAVFSRYARVLEPDGSHMRVRTALTLINQALDEILAQQEGEFDGDTRWAIAWYEQFGLGTGKFGDAETLSKAKNSSVRGLAEAGIVAAARGEVRLLARSEYSTDWDPAKDTRLPAWEATQRLVHALLDSGEGVAAEMQAKLGGLGEQARDLAYRLYQVAERKGWTDEALAYNALVVAWPDLLRGAERVSAAEPSQPSFGLE